MTTAINKSMDRADLFTAEGQKVVAGLNNLVHALYEKKLSTTSWIGMLPKDVRTPEGPGISMENRGVDYEALPGAADDGWLPWYLYWETFWVLTNGPQLKPGSKVLDAGGTSSLFTSYLASSGHEVHSVDMNETLVANGNKIAKAMGWNMHSYGMNMKALDFEDGFFDHAYSICVFEHLTFEIKQAALKEIARCLKQGGVLSITFDYRNPAPWIMGTGPDTSAVNALKCEDDIKRNFLSTDCFELMGNVDFQDNGKSYLVHPGFDDFPYTFGAIFLRKK